jgi:deoxyribonuclease V
VAGVDISFDRRSPILSAAVVVLDADGGEILERSGVRTRAGFPYVPGYLSFREIPPLLEAFARLECRPDLILCDGHGLAHPRRFGLACHLGVLLDLPTIGCAKSRLVGSHREPGPNRGARAALRHDGEPIGEALRTRTGVKPIYISIGHRVTLPTARRLVLRAAPRWRIPDPLRAAHTEANRIRRGDVR